MTVEISDEELLFQQWWTIECGRSMDEPHEKGYEIFMDGYKYAQAYLAQSGE